MNNQTTHTLFLVEPIAFAFNHQTAVNNFFQQCEPTAGVAVGEEARKEFDQMTETLRAKGVEVIVEKDTLDPHTPDSIFPNNWISFHEDGRVAVYPMFAENRRLERESHILTTLASRGFSIRHTTDYTGYEKENKFLEGTGSLVLDRVHRKAYAALSPRTHKELVYRFCLDFGYDPVIFHAHQTVDGRRLPVYHTNVMMCVADNYAVVCLNSIDSLWEREVLIHSLVRQGKDIIEISEKQMHCFAGNMLQVGTKEGKTLLVMSQSAYDSLTDRQRIRLLAYNEIVVTPIPVIEKYGGGSVRCMIAEVFLPQRF